MSKRSYKITGADGVLVTFKLFEVFQDFKGHPMQDTELAYTIQEDIDFLLDMKEREVKHYYEDRAKEFPCLIKRVN